MAIKHGCAPFGNAKARTMVWTFPDPIPLHREPLYTPRRDLLPKYQTYTDRKAWRLPTLYASIQKNDHSKQFPTILTSGRLVEYEGGGDEVALQQVARRTAAGHVLRDQSRRRRQARRQGRRQGLGAFTGRRQGAGQRAGDPARRRRRRLHAVPLRRLWQGKDLRAKYPKGNDPYVLGEASNMTGTYGYDSVTQMQETKVTLCRIEAA